MAHTFSDELGDWLKSNRVKTLGDLSRVFGERSFAITILLLMFLPALPLPTGGVTHIFEIITMLLALELIAGRRTIWLPKLFLQRSLGGRTLDKAVPFIQRRVRWFERFSRPRLSLLLEQRLFLRLAGVIILIFSFFAFIAIPFSGLDTLPAMGVVTIALALILGDVLIFLTGCLIGLIGIGVILGLSAVTFEAFRHLF